MPTIQINNFGGIAPRVHPTLLPEACAIKAHNCLLKNDKLVPLKEPGSVSVQSTDMFYLPRNSISNYDNAKTLHIWNQGESRMFVCSKELFDCVPGDFYEDEQYKFYAAGAKIGEDENYKDVYVIYKLGNTNKIMSLYKKPPDAPIVRVERNDPLTEEQKENLRYTYFFQSWVDELGFESEASSPSEEVEYLDGEKVYISALGYQPANAKKRRIYKVITGLELGGTPQFVYEQDRDLVDGFSEVSFDKKDEEAGEVMPSITNPHRKIEGICTAPGGYAIWCSCSPKTVRFSDGAPNNFPDEYAYEVEYEIVGLASAGNSVYVLTKGYPFVITGTSPDTMVVTKLASMQACVSRQSICVVDNAVYYASNDGLCMITEGVMTVNNVTASFFSKRDWEKVVSQDMIVCAYDSTLYLWNPKQTDIGYAICFIDETSAVTTFDGGARAVTVDPVTDKMYFITKDDKPRLVAWEDDDSVKKLTWRSKRIQTEKPLNLSSAQIYADGYPVKLIINSASSPDEPIEVGKNKVEVDIKSQDARRLPMRRPEKFIEVEVQSEYPINTIKLSTSMGEM